MNNFECVLIVNSLLTDDELEKITQKYAGLIEKFGGTIAFSEPWGRRRLAYPIKNSNRGYYHMFYFSGTGETVAEFRKQAAYDEEILRCFICEVKDLTSAHAGMVDLKNNPEQNRTKYLETLNEAV